MNWKLYSSYQNRKDTIIMELKKDVYVKACTIKLTCSDKELLQKIVTHNIESNYYLNSQFNISTFFVENVMVNELIIQTDLDGIEYNLIDKLYQIVLLTISYVELLLKQNALVRWETCIYLSNDVQTTKIILAEYIHNNKKTHNFHCVGRMKNSDRLFDMAYPKYVNPDILENILSDISKEYTYYLKDLQYFFDYKNVSKDCVCISDIHTRNKFNMVDLKRAILNIRSVKRIRADDYKIYIHTSTYNNKFLQDLFDAIYSRGVICFTCRYVIDDAIYRKHITKSNYKTKLL